MKHSCSCGGMCQCRLARRSRRALFPALGSPLCVGLLAALSCVGLGCSSDSPASDATSSGAPGASGASGSNTASRAGSGNTSNGNGGDAPGSTSGAPSSTPSIPVPDGGMTAPEATTTLDVTDAPSLGEIKYIPNRSSVRLYLPGVNGAHDYRVFAVADGVKVLKADSGKEHVDGADIYCAGWRQRNQCNNDEILPITYHNELLDMPNCLADIIDRRPNVPTELMQSMEIDGVAPNTTLIVEALDRQCPFPGLFGTTHKDVHIEVAGVGPDTVPAVVNDKSYSLSLMPATFPLRTEDEIRAQYGSMILNGQGPNQPVFDPKDPAFPESPYVRLAMPAPADDPVVLARSVIKVSPTGTAKLPEGFTDKDLFEDFEDTSDQPKLLRTVDPANDVLGVGTHFNTYLIKNWVLYDISNEFSDFSINRGHLNMVFGDPFQGSMSLQAMYPRARPSHFPTDEGKYLHITYEVQRIETTRRYENLALCGSDTAGETYQADGTLAAAPLPRPGFMNEDGTHPTNTLGWNCLTLVARGEGYGYLPGGDIMSHSDTSLKITVVRTHPAPAKDHYDEKSLDEYTTAFGPTQEGPYPRRWQRQVDGSQKPSGVWLDDQQNTWQKTRFDVFVRRNRIVIYVEGEPRICQELDPSSITMSDVAVGFWHILYHTSAEFTEMRAGGFSANTQTDQHHLLHNTPFADWRSYDNVGIRENVALPDGFDASRCAPAVGSP